MNRQRSSWLKPTALGLAVVWGAAAAAPAFASGRPAAEAKRPTSLAAAAAARVASLGTPALAAMQESAPAATGDSKPFLKTKKGAIALVLMAGAVTWAIVSRSQDAVHSPAR